MTPGEYLAKNMDMMFELGRTAARNAAKSMDTLCEESAEGQHVIGSRPNSCIECMRTVDNAR